jgi:hypothetical protein
MTTRRMRIACWVTKATDTHSQCEIYTDSYGNNGYANAPRYYVTRPLRVLVNLVVTFEIQTTCVSMNRISG